MQAACGQSPSAYKGCTGVTRRLAGCCLCFRAVLAHLEGRQGSRDEQAGQAAPQVRRLSVAL